MLDVGRVLFAADTFGAAQTMLDQAVAYSLTREQFNRPIGSFQAVKHMCAEMAAGLEPCQSLVWYAAHAVDSIPAKRASPRVMRRRTSLKWASSSQKPQPRYTAGWASPTCSDFTTGSNAIGLNRQLLGSPERLRDEAARAQALIA